MVMALIVLIGLVSCMPPCPPGTELSPDGVCAEVGAESEQKEAKVETEGPKEEMKKEAKEELKETGESKVDTEGAEKVEELKTDIVIPEEIPETEEQEDVELEGLPISERARQRLKEFKEIYDTKVQSYEFMDPEVGTYKIKGNMMKLVLLGARHKRSVKDGNRTIPLFYYDVIYHNFDTGVTEGYCEGLDTDLRRSCQQSGIENIPLPLKESDVEGLLFELPHNWLVNLLKSSVPRLLGEGKYYVHDRAVSRIDFQEPAGFVYFDPLNGLPIKLEIMHEGKLQRIDFKNLIIDTVKDSEMRNRPYAELAFEEFMN